MGSNKESTEGRTQLFDSTPTGGDFFFIPAGSFSSRHGSTLNSERDREEGRDYKEEEEGEDGSETRFVPTRENVIRFESATPTGTYRSRPSLSPTDFSPDFDFHPLTCKLAKTFNPHFSRTQLPLTSSLRPNFAALFDPEELNSEGSRVNTIDSVSDRKSDDLPRLKSRCAYYEAQNELLRQEVESCTRDLRSLDKAKRKAQAESSRLSEMVKEYRTVVGKVSELGEKVAGVLGSPQGEMRSEDVHHMFNHLESQIEILSSRHNRLKAMHDHLSDEHHQLLTAYDSLQSLHFKCSSSLETIDRLTCLLRSKDSQIEKLEDKLVSRGGSTASTVCYSSGRTSAEEKTRVMEMSPISGKPATPIEEVGSPDFAGLTPNNTPAVSFIAAVEAVEQRTFDLPDSSHTRTHSIKDLDDRATKPSKPKLSTSISPCVRAHPKVTQSRRTISPATALLKDCGLTLKASGNTTSSSRLTVTMVGKGKSAKAASLKPGHRKVCRV